MAVNIEEMRSKLLELPEGDPRRLKGVELGIIPRGFSEAGPDADFFENAKFRLQRFVEGMNPLAFGGGALGTAATFVPKVAAVTAAGGPFGPLLGVGLVAGGVLTGLGISKIFGIGEVDQEEMERINFEIDRTAPEGFWQNVAGEVVSLAPMIGEFVIGAKGAQYMTKAAVETAYLATAQKWSAELAEKGGAPIFKDPAKVARAAAARFERLVGRTRDVLRSSPEMASESKMLRGVIRSINTGGAFAGSATIREMGAADIAKEGLIGVAMGAGGVVGRGLAGEPLARVAAKIKAKRVAGQTIVEELGQTVGEAAALLGAGSKIHGTEASPEHFAEILATIAALRATHKVVGIGTKHVNPYVQALYQLSMNPNLTGVMRQKANQNVQAVERTIFRQAEGKAFSLLKEAELGMKRAREAAERKAKLPPGVVDENTLEKVEAGKKFGAAEIGGKRGISGRTIGKTPEDSQLRRIVTKINVFTRKAAEAAGVDTKRVKNFFAQLQAQRNALRRSPNTLERVAAELTERFQVVGFWEPSIKGKPIEVLGLSTQMRNLAVEMERASDALRRTGDLGTVGELVTKAQRVLGESGRLEVDASDPTGVVRAGQGKLLRAAELLRDTGGKVEAYLFTRGVQIRQQTGEGRPRGQERHRIPVRGVPSWAKSFERELSEALPAGREAVSEVVARYENRPGFQRYQRQLRKALLQQEADPEGLVRVEITATPEILAELRAGGTFGVADVTVGSMGEVAPWMAKVALEVPAGSVFARFGPGHPNRYLMDISGVRRFEVLSEPGILGERLMDRIDRYNAQVQDAYTELTLRPLQRIVEMPELIRRYKEVYGKDKWREAVDANTKILRGLQRVGLRHTTFLTVEQMAEQFGTRIPQLREWVENIRGFEAWHTDRMEIHAWGARTLEKYIQPLKASERDILNRYMQARSQRAGMTDKINELNDQIRRFESMLRPGDAERLPKGDREMYKRWLEFSKAELRNIAEPTHRMALEVLAEVEPKLTDRIRDAHYQIETMHMWAIDSQSREVRERDAKWTRDNPNADPLVPLTLKNMETLGPVRRASLQRKYQGQPELLEKAQRELDVELEKLLANPYYPAIRAGKYFVVGKVSGLPQGEGTVVMVAARSKGAAEFMQKDLNKRMDDFVRGTNLEYKTWISDPTKDPSGKMSSQWLNPIMMDQLKSNFESMGRQLDVEMSMLRASRDPGAKARLQIVEAQRAQYQKEFDTLNQTLEDYQPATSFYQKMRAKNWISGYEAKNFGTLHMNYVQHLANHLARAKWEPRFAKILSSLISDIKIMESKSGVREVTDASGQRVRKADIRTAQSERGITLDATELERVYGYLARHMRYMFQPVDEWPLLKGAMFSYYFWFMPKQLLMNFSQVPMVTFPAMSQMYGSRMAMNELLKAGNDYTAYWLRPAKNRTRFAWEMDMMERGKQQAFLDESHVVSVALEADVGKLAGWNIHSPVKRGFVRMIKAGVKPFEWSEQHIRHATFIAGIRAESKRLYREAVDRGETRTFEEWIRKAPENQLQRNAVFESGRRLVERTMFEYARWNRPQFMRNFGSPFFLFASFSQNMLRYWWKDPASARLLTALFMMGGAMGVPFAQNALDVGSSIMQGVGRREFTKADIERDMVTLLHEALGDDLGDMLMYGLGSTGVSPLIARAVSFASGVEPEQVSEAIPRSFLGDMSRSLGMGDILPVSLIADVIAPGLFKLVPGGSTPAPEQLDSRLLAGVLEAGGPAFGQIGRLFQAILNSGNPDGWKSAETMVPPVVRQAMRALRYLPDGATPEPVEKALNQLFGPLKRGSEYDRTGARVYETTLSEALTTLIGAQPTGVNKAWRERAWERESFLFYQTRRTGLLNVLAYARRNGYTKLEQETREDIRRFQQEVSQVHSALRIRPVDIRNSLSQRELSRRKAERLGGRTKAEIIWHRHYN